MSTRSLKLWYVGFLGVTNRLWISRYVWALQVLRGTVHCLSPSLISLESLKSVLMLNVEWSCLKKLVPRYDVNVAIGSLECEHKPTTP